MTKHQLLHILSRIGFANDWKKEDMNKDLMLKFLHTVDLQEDNPRQQDAMELYLWDSLVPNMPLIIYY